MSLAERAYRLTSSLPKDETYGLSSQIRRSAVSVAANIAEGANRNSRGEFLQFLGFASGSRAELSTLLTLVERIYPSIEMHPEIEEANRLGMMITRLRLSISRPKPRKNDERPTTNDQRSPPPMPQSPP